MTLAAAWLLYLAIVGPFLISARNTLLVLLGVALLVVMVYASCRATRSIMKFRKNA